MPLAASGALTWLRSKHKFTSEVFKKLTNLLLLLAVASSVAAGTPLHSDSGESDMMDCCKKALEKDVSPHVAAARLCCAMNCNEPGSTNSNTTQSSYQTGSEPTPPIVAALPAASFARRWNARYRRLSPTYSKPAYIVNLALLI